MGNGQESREFPTEMQFFKDILDSGYTEPDN